MERKAITPGELIVEGEDYLPGEGTEKRGKEIYALKFGLVEEMNKLIRIIPISGTYQPRRGNVVIGKVDNINFNGWIIDIGAPENGFLSLMEVPRYVNKDALEEVMEIGDMVVAKVWNMNKRGIDLSIKSRGFGKIDEGLIVKINPNKVPRVIGKEGSMVSLIKDETGCNITVGQNGVIWIQGETIEKELLAKEAIIFITENCFVTGLTEEVKEWFEEKSKMTEKELTNKVVLELLKEWSSKGPLCNRLIQGGYSFVPKQIEGMLNLLEKEGKILSYPRGMMETINYISTKSLTSEQRRIYRSENRLLINPIQSSGVGV